MAIKQRAPPQKCSVGGAVWARAHLSCEKLSRKSVATLGWRANTVRPYSLYDGEKVVDDPEAQLGRISTECGAGVVEPIIPGHTAAAAPS